MKNLQTYDEFLTESASFNKEKELIRQAIVYYGDPSKKYFHNNVLDVAHFLEDQFGIHDYDLEDLNIDMSRMHNSPAQLGDIYDAIIRLADSIHARQWNRSTSSMHF